jgi:4-hydroxybenzoate polyprenyltransferase
MTLRDFFTWVRIPTVFSSLGNAYAGWYIGGHGQVTSLILGMAAAGMFLMAGMGLNDIADVSVDKIERPNRPLPSGAISLRRAWLLALAMLVLGLGLQGLANPRALSVGVTLIAAIFLYNFALKNTWLGPIAMGLCRLLNLMAGMALNWQAWPSEGMASFSLGARVALISLGCYIAAVTYLARDEVQGNAQGRVRFFLFGLGLWTGGWIALGVRGLAPWWAVVATLAALAILIASPLRALWRKASPAHTGRMVGTLLRGIPLVDMLGLWAAGAGWPIALSAVLFMVPGPILMKRFYST